MKWSDPVTTRIETLMLLATLGSILAALCLALCDAGLWAWVLTSPNPIAANLRNSLEIGK